MRLDWFQKWSNPAKLLVLASGFPLVASLTETVWVGTGSCLPSSGTPPPASSSPYVVVYTTTNSEGSTITTSSTSYSVISSSSTDFITITTTNSVGSTITLTSTSIGPISTPSVLTTVTKYTTTDSTGGLVTTSSTIATTIATSASTTSSSITTTGYESSGSTTASSISQTSSTTRTGTSSAPTSSSSSYFYTDSSGRTYEISENTDYPYSDLEATVASSLESCVEDCSNYQPQANVANNASCVAATFAAADTNGGNCFLKYAITYVNPGAIGVEGCRLTSYTPATPPITITPSSVILSASNTLYPSGSILSSGSTSGPSISTVSSPTWSSSTISSSASPSAPALPCPEGNNTVYTDASGYEYQIFCATDFELGDLPSVSADTFISCIAACDLYAPTYANADGAGCVGVTWATTSYSNGNNCFLKSGIGSIVGNSGYDSARRSGYNSLSASTSTTSTSGISGTGQSTTSSTTTQSGGSSLSVSSSSSVASSSYSSSSSMTASTSPSASGIAFPCPALDGQTYSDNNGHQYHIDCGASYDFGDLISVSANTFEDCMEGCDSYQPNSTVASGAGCIACTWVAPGSNGNTCFLKFQIASYSSIDYSNPSYDSARQINYYIAGVSSSRTISSTATSSASSTSGISSTSASSSSYSYSSISSSSTTSLSGPTSVSSTTASTSPTATDIGYPCPALDGQTYSDKNNEQYHIDCGASYDFGDLIAVSADTFEECMEGCDNYKPNSTVAQGAGCIAVTWVAPASNGNTCFLKFQISSYSSFDYSNPAYDGARQISYSISGISSSRIASTSTSTASTTSSTTGVSSTSGSSSLTTSTSSSSGGYSLTSVSSTTSTGSGSTSMSSMSTTVATSTYLTSSSTVYTSTVAATIAAQPCPAGNNSEYTDANQKTYIVYCGGDFNYDDLTTTFTSTFSGCMEACDSYNNFTEIANGLPCVAVTWAEYNANGANCYLKYRVQAVDITYTDSDYDSARLMSYEIVSNISTDASSSSSTSTSTPMSTSTSSVSGSTSTTPTGTSSSISSTTTSTSSSTSTDTSTSTDSSSSTSSTTTESSSSTSSTTTDSSSSTSSTSTDTSSTSTDTSSTSTDTSSTSTDSSSSTSSASTSTSSITSSSSTSSALSSPTDGAYDPGPICPEANNTQYMDYAGTIYNIYCGLSINNDGQYYETTHAENASACIEYCDILGYCSSVSFSSDPGFNCEPNHITVNLEYNSDPTYLSAVIPDDGLTPYPYDYDTLCSPTVSADNYNQSVWTGDPAYPGRLWYIECNQTTSGTTFSEYGQLIAGQASSLDGCIQFCDGYDGCVAVQWTDNPNYVTDNIKNCIPYSNIDFGGFAYSSDSSSAYKEN